MPTISLENTKIVFKLTDNSGSAPPPTYIYYSSITTTIPSATCIGGTATNEITCTNAKTLVADKIYSLAFKFAIAPDGSNTNF